MDKRAFEPASEPQETVQIDLLALNHIKDIAIKIFHMNRKLNQHQLLYMALHDYMVIKGAKPNFTVNL